MMALRGWRLWAVFAVLLLAVFLFAPLENPAEPGAVLFEGARVITSAEPGAIEGGAFLVEDGRFTAVGLTGAIPLPADGVRVDLAGKTVIPALVNAHVHLGYDRGATFTASQLHAGQHPRPARALRLRRRQRRAVARHRPGRHCVRIRAQQEMRRHRRRLRPDRRAAAFAPPNAGPANPAMKPAAYGVTTEAEARAGVREQTGRNVRIIKIWVDDRNGTVPKLSARAVRRRHRQEAHRNSTLVIAHVYYLADARALVAGRRRRLRAPAARLGHRRGAGPRDEARGVFVLSRTSRSARTRRISRHLPGSTIRCSGSWCRTEDVERLRASYSRRTPAAADRAAASYLVMQRSLAALNAVGARIGFGTTPAPCRTTFTRSPTTASSS